MAEQFLDRAKVRPACSRCVANECRSACGLMPNRVLQLRDVARDQALRRCGRSAGRRGSSRTAGPARAGCASPGDAGCHRGRSGSASARGVGGGRCRSARGPSATPAALASCVLNGTSRSLPPFPITRTMRPGRLTSSTSSPTSSLRRSPTHRTARGSRGRGGRAASTRPASPAAATSRPPDRCAGTLSRASARPPAPRDRRRSSPSRRR